MPSARYYIDQARTLLNWARTTKDKTYARLLRQKAGELLVQANDARAAVSDLNPLLADFNDRQMRGSGPDEGAGG
jgi:predicted negative regulator of RcsB-dependent stress response